MHKLPHLATALKSLPLFAIEQKILANKHKIEHWLRCKWQQHTPPFYGSVDLRNSGFKIAPVDMNLFPGGFNNISQQSMPLAVQAVSHMLERCNPSTQKMLLIPENHTRNSYYLKNVHALKDILEQSGLEIAIGSLSPEITAPTEIRISPSKTLTYYPLNREGNRIKTSAGFDPCCVLLNNDLSKGCPEILAGLEQQLVPPLNAGWYMRKKTNFFAEYDKVVAEFAKLIDIDPWMINPFFDKTADLDFTNSHGLDSLAEKVAHVLEKTKEKYQEHKVKEEPYVIVKANNGTYGMGIMVVHHSEEILLLNRKTRNKMATVKDGSFVNEVIIQEGVHTLEDIDKKVAEPVVYMMDSAVIGGFYRVHPSKGRNDNLNAVGAEFVPMSFINSCRAEHIEKPICPPNRFYTYGTIARLSLLASSIELSLHTL
jgi:glutamate--cysteine ligase